MMRTLALAILPLLLIGCSNTGEEKQEPKPMVGKYVYKDSHRVIHIDRECDKIFRGVRRIPSNELKRHQRYCSKCVNDEAYEILAR